MAYTIDGHRKGTYWLTYFRMDSLKQPELTRACRLNENILRNMVIRIDDRLVDTLVRHAQSGGATSGAPEGKTIDRAADNADNNEAKQDSSNGETEES